MRTYFDETLKTFVAEEKVRPLESPDVKNLTLTITGFGQTRDDAIKNCMEKLQESREKAGE